MISQDAFTQALLDPNAATPAGLIDPKGETAPKRFAVYRNNVAVSLTNALKEGFPVVHKLVGDDFFTAMASIFIRKHPPQNPLMMHYGAELPTFLTNFAPAAKLGYLPDMARLELAMRRSYHAADARPIAADLLSSIEPDALMSMYFTLAPAVQILRSRWPIYSIWAANMLDAEPPNGAGGQAVLITRAEFDPVPHLLGVGAATFIGALAEHNFGTAHDAALTAAPDFDLSAAVGVLLAGNAITSITESPLT